jgi:KaiC/GvpD/RAD55 family RecA-like ATPase
MANSLIDREQLYKWWSVFHTDGEITEIRAFSGKANFSGYYKDVENAIRDIEFLETKQDLQVYFIINAIKEDCYGRVQRERLAPNAKTTSDSEIIGRKWLMIDLDPKRTAGISSSNEELEYARLKARDVFRFLRDNGFNDPVVCMSGNGYHLMYPCRIAVSEETDKLVERFINALAMLFTDDKVDVDKQCKNKARLSKVYGTIAKKGSNSEDRPWRTSRIVSVPDEIKPNDIEYIKKIAELYPEDKPKPSSDNNWGQEKFDVESFLTKHGIGYKKETYGDGVKFILDHCVFNEQHKGKDACIFQRNSGGLAYVCLHSSCSHYTWKDFRMKFEPDAYDKKEYKEFQFKQKYYGQTTTVPFTPISETDDKGKKWLTPRDIKRLREEDIVAIPTGYSYLDKAIRGLILGEVTILSGSNGSGKSSWLNSVMLNVIQRGFKVACFSGELTDYNVMKWLSQSAAGKNYVHKVDGSEYAYEVDDSAYEKICNWLDGKFYLFNNNYGNRFEQVLSDLEEVVNEGVQFVVIDNLMSLSISGLNGDKNEKQKQFILDVVEFAKRRQVHVVVVCHPRKESGSQTLLRKESIAGSSDLSNAVQNVAIVHRCGEDFCKRASEFFGKDKADKYMEYSNVVEWCKSRSYGVVDYLVGMYYEPETKRFKNHKAEHIVYGWDDEPAQHSFYEPKKEERFPFGGVVDCPF